MTSIRHRTEYPVVVDHYSFGMVFYFRMISKTIEAEYD